MVYQIQIERSDTASPVLRLGSMLINARRESLSGAIEVRDQRHRYTVFVSGGTVSGLLVNGRVFGRSRQEIPFVEKTALTLFSLRRPHVLWQPEQSKYENEIGISSGYIVLNGVANRRDLFAPLQLVKRMPVETLSIGSAKMKYVRQLPLDSSETRFVENLRVPTPIPMILWKRGLEPSRAGALLVALNLIGVFDSDWAPGDLPRMGTVASIRKKLGQRCSDYEILGVDAGASSGEIDTAFRRLSLDLHPDRLGGLPSSDICEARDVFAEASAAYSRLKSSRRRRPVQVVNNVVRADPFSKNQELEDLLILVRDYARSGSAGRARAYAIKALALSPGRAVRNELIKIIRAA